MAYQNEKCVELSEMPINVLKIIPPSEETPENQEFLSVRSVLK